MAPNQLERFLAKTALDHNGCLVWTGASDGRGYGQFMLDGRRRPGKRPLKAHRVSYEHFVGPIPDGLTLDHLCRNRACVHPDHLEPVTQGENCRRGIKGVLTTHCPQGHPYSGDNLIVVKKTGWRQCRACHRQRDAERRSRLRGTA